MRLTRAGCPGCGVGLDGEFESSALGLLTEADQAFVVAFLRHHGSIRKMESLFDISYPTVKNRLRSIVEILDRSCDSLGSNSEILARLSRGEISVDEALQRLKPPGTPENGP